ncbi:hypothetical protein E6P06_14245 [Citrobacter sp. CF971]|nr:hypothetical protein E6P06_14245 [Citrobacter sp. CF971]
MYLSLRLIVFFLCNCRVIKKVDYILLILRRVFYSGCALGESHLIVKLRDVLHSCVLESLKSLILTLHLRTAFVS